MLLDSFKIYTSMRTLFQKIKIFFNDDSLCINSLATICCPNLTYSPIDFSLKIFYNRGMFSCIV